MKIDPLETLSSAPYLLFVAGNSPNSRAAIANLQRALRVLDLAPTAVEIIDVYERPDFTSQARVMVTPALVRRSDPRQRIIGDLSVPGQIADFLQ